jgi:tRNA A-37 threonylcarbamoyl transferase component Bud32
MTENAKIDRKCERCGAALAADAPEGLCPRCLMALNLATQTEAPGAEVGPDGTQVVSPKREPAPPLEEIARQFPQLEILECLGRGGMGVVYKARQPRLNRFVALKILAREKEKDPRFAERFTREAQSLARLNHPNIVTVYDFGETNGLYYLLMEFVDGMSLRQLLETRKLAPEEALTIVPPICEALEYAHHLGIVHRDIKPENILLDKQGRVKIADYGIAKLLGADGRVQSLTGEQGVVGTPHYMAPEQVEKPSIVDHRADIYSLGVVFYEMLTGELPLGKFAPPSRMVKMDVRLDEVVLHALEKEPELRYQQASQVKTDVETIARTEGGGAKSEPGRNQPTPNVAAASGADSAWRQVKGPGTGLVVTAILNWVAIPLVSLVALVIGIRTEGHHAYLVLVPLGALVLSSIMLVAGLMMKRLAGYGLAVAGAILAILVTPGNLIGLPIGIWALVVLSRREVREAFGKGLPMPGQPSRGGGAWKVVAVTVIVAPVLVLLAISVAGMLSAIAIPNFVKARATAKQRQAGQRVPTFMVRGTVTDVVTGRPIAGARVDDNAYGARPNRPPQQAWTDAEGHYELRTWYEEHTLAASAPGYATKLCTFITSQGFGVSGQTNSPEMLVPADKLSAYSFATTKLVELKRQENELLLQFTESHPLVQNVRDRMGKLTREKADLEQQYPSLAHPTVGPGYGGTYTVSPRPDQQAQIDFQLQPAEAGEQAASGPETQALDETVKRGNEAWKREDYSKALALLLPAALKGHPVAQHRIGVMYVMGQGVGEDFAEATRWFRKAAEQGQGESQYSMGMRYLLGQSVAQDEKEAVRWFKLAADQGLAVAEAALALRYFKGEGVAQDFVEAYKWAMLASDQVGPNNGGIPPSHLEDKLTPDQLVEAQRRVKEFAPKRTAPADP